MNIQSAHRAWSLDIFDQRHWRVTQVFCSASEDNVKHTRAKPEIDSWFDRSYLNAALKELNLEGYWPAYPANGQQVGR